jgi:hypothetical protein
MIHALRSHLLTLSNRATNQRDHSATPGAEVDWLPKWAWLRQADLARRSDAKPMRPSPSQEAMKIVHAQSTQAANLPINAKAGFFRVKLNCLKMQEPAKFDSSHVRKRE